MLIYDSFLSNQEFEVGNLATVCAINTVSHYLLEFRDEVKQRWMTDFLNYSHVGFPGDDWTHYIETMIKTDAQFCQVLMRAPKSFRRGKHSHLGSNVVLKYDLEIGALMLANQSYS